MENEQIIFKNIPVLEFYPGYRDEQKNFAKTKTYGELYKLLAIYIEKFTNTIERFQSDLNESNTSLYSTRNMVILVCLLIILYLIINY
jgi:hypothetical protein